MEEAVKTFQTRSVKVFFRTNSAITKLSISKSFGLPVKHFEDRSEQTKRLKVKNVLDITTLQFTIEFANEKNQFNLSCVFRLSWNTLYVSI